MRWCTLVRCAPPSLADHPPAPAAMVKITGPSATGSHGPLQPHCLSLPNLPPKAQTCPKEGSHRLRAPDSAHAALSARPFQVGAPSHYPPCPPLSQHCPAVTLLPDPSPHWELLPAEATATHLSSPRTQARSWCTIMLSKCGPVVNSHVHVPTREASLGPLF